MITTCHELGITITAEGIETVEERDALLEVGCDLMQGYLFARPGPAFPEPSGVAITSAASRRSVRRK